MIDFRVAWSIVWRFGLGFCLACLGVMSVVAREDVWRYPANIDAFGAPIPEPKTAALVKRAKSRRPAPAEDEAAEAHLEKPKFTALMLVGMKKAGTIQRKTLLQCEREMDDCFKSGIARGMALATASDRCRTEDVCLLPVALDYRQFTLVSGLIKSAKTFGEQS
jgi:hypothetical protein